MGWIIGLIVGGVFIYTLATSVPPQVWIVLAVIVVVIVWCAAAKNKRRKRRIIESPEFQRLLGKARRLQEICGRMPDAKSVDIERYDVVDYKFIDTHEGNPRKNPFTPKEAAQERYPTFFCFQVTLGDVACWVPTSMSRYLESHRELCKIFPPDPAKEKSVRATRDACGESLMDSLFGTSENWKSFLQLSGLEAVDVVFDCIDRTPYNTDDLIFHFKFYCLEFDGSKEKLELLLKELKNPSTGKKRKAAKKKKAAARPNAGQYHYFQCTCGIKIRVPADKGHIVAPCPNPMCSAKWDINGGRIHRIQ